MSIYKITSPHTDKCYVGSTTKTLEERLDRHERDYELYKKNKYDFVSSYHILELNDYKIELVELTNNLKEREGYWIRTLNSVNRKIEGRTQKEYREDNKEKIKQYREDNKDHYKQYRENNKEKIKQYREDNRDKIIQFKKEYYQLNKDRINEIRTEKITCECGAIISKTNIAKHKKTKKHINRTQQS